MTTQTSGQRAARTPKTTPHEAPNATPSPAPDFAELGVPAPLVASLAAAGITSPFPIQTATLPDSLAGRDVLGRGRTGSGKTLAFALPMVARLAAPRAAGGPSGSTAHAGASPRRARPGHPRALVLAPTRELATQIAETVQPLADAVGLTVTTVFGGVSQARQETALRAGVDIVVACPGRLEDLKGQGIVSLAAVEITVLDEADHMADLGFLPTVRRLLDTTPKGGQRLLFSATLDGGVDVLVKRYLTNPVTHSVDPASSPVVALTHHVFEVADVSAKRDVVEQLASGTGRRLLFTRTKHQARQLARKLTAAGIPAADLHGNLSQNARERNLAAFSSGEVRVMVATDIAARGIHVDDVDLVVHVDPPAEHKAYLHRSGRTARAGAGGDVVTLMLPEQRGDVRALTRDAKIRATPVPVNARHPEVLALRGEEAPRVAPSAAPAGAARKPEPQGPRRASAGGRSGGGRSGAPARSGRPAKRSGSRPAATSASTQPRRARPTATPAPAARIESRPAAVAEPRQARRGRRRASRPQG